jgi:SAM-dependent methyltransferase
MPRKPAADQPADAPPKKRRSRARVGAWKLPPLPWILNAGRSAAVAPAPQRILCLNLAEAFALASHLRDIDITLLESDEEIAAQARTAARRRRLANLRIEHGNVDQPALGELVGGNYDAIIAHDVLHRVADPQAALRNLSAACAPDGSLYLALRCSGHPSTRFSEALGAFGLDRHEIDGEDNESSRIARLLVALGQFLPPDGRPLHGDETKGEGRSLASWIELAGQCGLHLRATTLTAQTLPAALAGGGTGPLASFNLPRLAALLEDFLRPPLVEVVFSRSAQEQPPWRDPEALAHWRPVSRFLQLGKLEPLPPPYTDAASVDVEIDAVLPSQNFQLSRYLLEILRRSDGQSSLADLMGQIPHQTTPAELVPGLHFLHHAFILELLPPT